MKWVCGGTGFNNVIEYCEGMMKMVDMLVLETSGRKVVPVQIWIPSPTNQTGIIIVKYNLILGTK